MTAYGVWMLFNLFDWVVLDELLIGMVRPSWLTLKGAEHIPLRFDHAEHATAFLKGSIGGAVVAAVVAFVVAAVGSDRPALFGPWCPVTEAWRGIDVAFVGSGHAIIA